MSFYQIKYVSFEVWKVFSTLVAFYHHYQNTTLISNNSHIKNFVAYWPPTQPRCQNRKCTCVNNRCIQSRNIRIWPWLSRDWIECEIETLAGRRVDVKLLYNPGYRKFKSVGEKMLEWRPCPREAGPPGPRLSSPGEREGNAVMAIRVGVNMFQFCSVSNSPLTQ